MTAPSGEKVLVLQSIIGGRCTTATGGAAAWCSSNGLDLGAALE